MPIGTPWWRSPEDYLTMHFGQKCGRSRRPPQDEKGNALMKRDAEAGGERAPARASRW